MIIIVIIAGDKTLEQAPQAKGIALAMTLFHGTEEAVRRIHEKKLPAREDVPVCNKFTFPEVMNPSDSRNDFYVFLQAGTFLQDGKTSAKNIRIQVTVHDRTGQQIQVNIFFFVCLFIHAYIFNLNLNLNII